jgi:hypothetical protein
MSFSLGPKGGIHDPVILRLLAELTTLVKAHGSKSAQVIEFIEKNKDITFVDTLSNHMHTFKEVAEPMSLLIGGIKINPEDEKIPGDEWQHGSTDKKKETDDPADWWKNDS